MWSALKKIRKDKIIELIPNPLYIKNSLILAPNFPKIFEFISFLSKKLFSELWSISPVKIYETKEENRNIAIIISALPINNLLELDSSFFCLFLIKENIFFKKLIFQQLWCNLIII